MSALSLDLSSKTGWCFLDGPKMEYGVFEKMDINDQCDMVEIFCLAKKIAHQVDLLVKEKNPTTIVIERPTKGRLAQTQSFLNFIHFAVLDTILNSVHEYKVKYVWPATWRATLDLKLSNDQKKQNKLVSQAKKTGKKKPKGIRGKINKKHLAINYVNQRFNLKLKVKDNDIADAICIALAGELL